MLPHVMNHEDVLKAALTCDYEIMLRAFRRDPLVTCSSADADKLLRKMIVNTKKYLPEGWQKISLNPSKELISQVRLLTLLISTAFF